jgi:hypothetical protein
VQAGNLLLPIHAYPLPNQPTFPKRLDLGRVALGDTISKTVQLSCRVPIDVGYELSWQPEPEALSVSPASGTIPAGEAVELVFSYTPASYTTQRVDLKVCWLGQGGGGWGQKSSCRNHVFATCWRAHALCHSQAVVSWQHVLWYGSRGGHAPQTRSL